MAETLVPIRNALAEAYMGDTKVVKDLFSSHETFDQRIVEILTGLGQHVDVRQPSAISTADIAECLRTLNQTQQIYRLALLSALARSYFGDVSVSDLDFSNSPSLHYEDGSFSLFSLPDLYFKVSRSLYSYAVSCRYSFSLAGLLSYFGDTDPYATRIGFRANLPFSSPSIPVGESRDIRFSSLAFIRCQEISDPTLKYAEFSAPFDVVASFRNDKILLSLDASSSPHGADTILCWSDLWYPTGISLNPDAYGRVSVNLSFSFTDP